MILVAIGLFYLHHLKKKHLPWNSSEKGTWSESSAHCTLMAFREPLNNMLCDETSVHTGLSWARIVLTFCRVWMSHTCAAAIGDGEGGGERSTTTRWHWRDARRRCRLALGAATHDDGAVCRAAVQPVPVDKGKKISRVSSGTDMHLMMMFRVCVEKEKRKAQRYPCMHSANTMPSWPSRVFWHL